MHFQCSLSDLLPVVNLVEKAVAAQDNIQVLKGIYISAADNQVTLTATNLELGIRSEFPAHINQPGQAVVDGKLLAALVRTLPQEPVVFELTDQQLMITAGAVEFSLTTMPPEDFPQLPEIDDLVFTLKSEQLLKLIKTRFSPAARMTGGRSSTVCCLRFLIKCFTLPLQTSTVWPMTLSKSNSSCPIPSC